MLSQTQHDILTKSGLSPEKFSVKKHKNPNGVSVPYLQKKGTASIISEEVSLNENVVLNGEVTISGYIFVGYACILNDGCHVAKDLPAGTVVAEDDYLRN